MQSARVLNAGPACPSCGYHFEGDVQAWSGRWSDSLFGCLRDLTSCLVVFLLILLMPCGGWVIKVITLHRAKLLNIGLGCMLFVGLYAAQWAVGVGQVVYNTTKYPNLNAFLMDNSIDVVKVHSGGPLEAALQDTQRVYILWHYKTLEKYLQLRVATAEGADVTEEMAKLPEWARKMKIRDRSPPVLLGELHRYRDDWIFLLFEVGTVLTAVVFLAAMWYFRLRIRRKYSLPSSDCVQDACVVLLCCPCAVAQEYRHVARATGHLQDLPPVCQTRGPVLDSLSLPSTASAGPTPTAADLIAEMEARHNKKMMDVEAQV
ncbi:unnamed protein product [Vitrella brassicaformis CCMP3155]|uniref:Uncharacterized protein n=1 Tax=Vitrella brassicaformis (strain CCMP3155) TaxID=1169540 RepID=A0A0G4EGI2_VITBC|nr:unnamed protein product [Vitrella brassicaformis CCMP3155]|eukprot:CEL94575.1 unnamed protein product [Vitrella brassicaformis CCMP3155]